MNVYLTTIRREYQEHFGVFVILPLCVAALLILIMIYASIKVPNDNMMLRFGMEQFETEATDQRDVTDEPEYIIDFTTGELEEADEETLAESHSMTVSEGITTVLYGVQFIFLGFTSLIVFYYLLYCLYADRKDRSILFWKSMPVSELQSVGVKFFVALLMVPLTATVIAWPVELCVLWFAQSMANQAEPGSWSDIGQDIPVVSTFARQALIVVWGAVWLLPIHAWLLFSSALARREPFLIAVIPVVAVIVIESLIFGTNYIGGWIGEHFEISSIQSTGTMPDVVTGFQLGTGLGTGDLLAGILIAGGLITAAVWLRNYRFEL